jgi:DNA-binding MarR family transcriptional regulator
MLIADWQRVTHRLLGALDDELEALGLSAGEVNLLACLAEAAPQTAGALGAATGQRPSTLTGVLDRLERGGLVKRTQNPADRRSTLVSLTANGLEAAGHVAAAFERVAARLPEDTAADAQRLLAAVERHL